MGIRQGDLNPFLEQTYAGASLSILQPALVTLAMAASELTSSRHTLDKSHGPRRRLSGACGVFVVIGASGTAERSRREVARENFSGG
jgi:hypothetical protein